MPLRIRTRKLRSCQTSVHMCLAGRFANARLAYLTGCLASSCALLPKPFLHLPDAGFGGFTFGLGGGAGLLLGVSAGAFI